MRFASVWRRGHFLCRAAALSSANIDTGGARRSRPNPTRHTAPARPQQPGDPFGEDTTLTAKPIVYVKGTGNWDNAFETITGSLKTLKAYVDKEGLKADGQPMTIFTSTDDTGFQFQAAIPLTEAPKIPPRGDIARRHVAGRPRTQIRPSRIV